MIYEFDTNFQMKLLGHISSLKDKQLNSFDSGIGDEDGKKEIELLGVYEMQKRAGRRKGW